MHSLMPQRRELGTGILLRCEHHQSAIVSRSLQLLAGLHNFPERWTYPMNYFEFMHRSIAAEAERTNLLPLVVTGLTWNHVKRLKNLGASLSMSPRTVMLVSPASIVASSFFKMLEPEVLANPEFVKFLESVNLPQLGAHMLRGNMRGYFERLS